MLTFGPSSIPLDLQVEQEADFGEPNLVVDLIPKGGEVAVTAENRQQYVTAYVQHLLTKSVKRQSQAFCKGFKKVSWHAAADYPLIICTREWKCRSFLFNTFKFFHVSSLLSL